MSHSQYGRQEWIQDLWVDMGNELPTGGAARSGAWLHDDQVREVFDVLRQAGIGGDDFTSGDAGHPDFGTTRNGRSETENYTPSVADLAKLYTTDGEGNTTLRSDWTDNSTPQADRPLDQGVDQSDFTGATKHWEGTRDYGTRGAGTPHSDDPTTTYTGSQFVLGDDPSKTTVNLSDINRYMAIEYEAPGRQGKEGRHDHNPRKGYSVEENPDYSTVAGQEAVENLTTRFVDDLYSNVTDGVITDGSQQPILNAEVNNNWGLDLVRDWSNKALSDHFGEGVNKNNLDEQQSYEWQTRGLVDWEFYRNDAAFAAAFRDQFPDDEHGNTAFGLDESAGITSVGEIRELLPSVYETMIERGQGKDSWRTTWEGKYEPPPVKPPHVAVDLDIDALTVGQDKIVKDEQAAGPTREVISADVFRQSLNIGRTEVQRPDMTFDSGRQALWGLGGPVADRQDPLQTTQPKGD